TEARIVDSYKGIDLRSSVTQWSEIHPIDQHKREDLDPSWLLSHSYTAKSNSSRSRLVISASRVSHSSMIWGPSRTNTAFQASILVGPITATAALSHSGYSRSSAIIMLSSSAALFVGFWAMVERSSRPKISA